LALLHRIAQLIGPAKTYRGHWPSPQSKQQPQAECQPLGPEAGRFGNARHLIAWPGHTAPVQEVVAHRSAAVPVELVSRIDIDFGNHGESVPGERGRLAQETSISAPDLHVYDRVAEGIDAWRKRRLR